VLGTGPGLAATVCRTEAIAEAASLVQTAGFGLPVLAVAASARRIDAAAASMTGAMRHGVTRRAGIDA
jgi:hypothetical protein